MWERIDYFLARVVPVADEYRVQLACHPQDPGIEEREYRGVARVMGTVDGLKRFTSMHENPYHGLNFCQGTISEMLERPGEEIYDVIRYFGTRKKIFNVHFRNIKGGLMDFVEVFPDEGDVDMLRAVRTYKEVGYPYMLMPDHVPDIDGDEAEQVGSRTASGTSRRWSRRRTRWRGTERPAACVGAGTCGVRSGEGGSRTAPTPPYSTLCDVS